MSLLRYVYSNNYLEEEKNLLADIENNFFDLVGIDNLTKNWMKNVTVEKYEKNKIKTLELIICQLGLCMKHMDSKYFMHRDLIGYEIRNLKVFKEKLIKLKLLQKTPLEFDIINYVLTQYI